MSTAQINFSTFVVALTGGIASGKTAVSDAFAELGASIVDTDLIARQVVAAGTSGLKSVVDTFGQQILDSKGNLDRKHLREIIFADTKKRKLLESILHPLIRTEAIYQLENTDAKVSILVVPLLVESGRAYDWVQRVLVVDVPEATQIERLTKRDGINFTQAKAILSSQASREQRLQIADDILANNKNLTDLKATVAALYDNYLKLANPGN